MRYNKLNMNTQVSQKNRRMPLSKSLQVNWGNTAIVAKTKLRFELIYFALIKKYLKKLRVIKFKSAFNSQVAWVFCKSNYPLSKKSKNSRMGKGKGTFLRWAVILQTNAKLFEFYNYDIIRLQKFLSKLNKISGNNFSLVKKI